MTARPRLRCVCGRVIAVRYATQAIGRPGGKARAPHLCPHGRPCIAGRSNQGFSVNALCADCVRDEASRRT